MSRSDMRFTRRGFVAGAGATALAAGLAGCASGTTGDEATDLASTAPEPAAYDAAEGTWVPTTCNMCFNNCSIKAHVVDGTVVELTGNPDSPIGSGHICAKGAAGIMQLYDPARITKPLKRTNPKKGFDEDPGWEEISWDEAYDTIVQKFGEAAAKDPKLNMGASMVAGLIGSVWRSLTLGCAFGVSEGTSSDICGAGVHICEFLLTGDGNAMPDYDNVDYLIQFGTQAGTATRHGFNMTADKFARRRAEDGLRLVNFDPHMSAGAEKADLWVPIRPGSDAAAALAMAYVAATGDTTYTPVEFAQWATDHDLTAAGVDTIGAFLQQGGTAFGLAVDPMIVDDRTLRHAIVSNVPVLVVTQPGTFAPASSVVVLDDIDKDSHIVLHDPTSASRSAKGWAFDDITDAAALAFTVHEV